LRYLGQLILAAVDVAQMGVFKKNAVEVADVLGLDVEVHEGVAYLDSLPEPSAARPSLESPCFTKALTID